MCGYAVDWLRSCYSSRWRLFAGNPGNLTPGYYWFCDPATPFYPGLHNLGSRNWVNPELIDPPLGEASGPQTYFKGALPVAVPPPLLIGSADCLANGEHAGDVPPGAFPGGIDSRCYPAGQAPDPSPALWLVASDLAGTTVGQTVPYWIDRSIYRRDASRNPQTASPLFDTSVFAGGAVCLARSYGLNLPATLSLRTDFTVFAVAAYLGSPTIGSFAILSQRPTQANGPFVWVPGSLRAVASPGAVIVPVAPDPVPDPHLFVCRCVTGVCHLRVDGVEIGAGGLPPTATFPCLSVGSALLPVAGLAGLQLAEVRAYDQPLSDAGFAAIESGLIAQYGL